MTVSQPSVALVVDHPDRDLAGLVLVAMRLARAGVTCHLVPLNLQQRELFALAPDVAVLNFFRDTNEATGRLLLEAGIRVVIADTEGGVWEEFDHYAAILWRDAAARAGITRACLWGRAMAGQVVDHGILGPEQVVVTGCPRFDLYHPRWRRIDGELAGRRQVLLNTNFSVSNPRFVPADRNIAGFAEAIGWDEARVSAYVEREQGAIAGMIELAARLAADFPALDVTLRPHPFESHQPYIEGLRGAPRVRVDNAGPVQPEIARAVAVVQRSCTTAIEAGLAGVPALSPRWIPSPVEIPVAEDVSWPCPAYAALQALVAAPPEAGSGAPGAALDAVIRDWFHAADGGNHERVADAILAALPGEREVREEQCHRFVHGLVPGAGARERVSGQLRRGLGVGPDWSFAALQRVGPEWWATTTKAFTPASVAAMVERLGAANAGSGATLRVCPAGDVGAYHVPFEGRAVTVVAEGP